MPKFVAHALLDGYLVPYSPPFRHKTDAINWVWQAHLENDSKLQYVILEVFDRKWYPNDAKLG